jgi:SAM-dependent methyltransferase
VDADAQRVPAASDAAGWGFAAVPGGLARDVVHAAGDAGEGRPTTPEAVSSANTAAMAHWMERISTSMGMSPSKKSSLASLLDPGPADDSPELYCFSPGRSSVQTLASALSSSASAPSIGPGGAAQPQRRRAVTEAERLVLLADLEKRVRHASFLRGDCGPRLNSSGNQLVDLGSTRPRGLLDAPAAEDDANHISFLRANLKEKASSEPGVDAVREGLLDHGGRVAGMVDRMQSVDQRSRNPNLHETRKQCAKVWSSWIVRPACTDAADGEGEEAAAYYEPSFTSGLPLERRSAQSGQLQQQHQQQQQAADPKREAATPTAERARKALARVKAEKKQREAQTAAQQEKKKASMAVVDAARQREAEAYSRRLSMVRSKLSSDASRSTESGEEERERKGSKGSSPSAEERRAAKDRRSAAERAKPTPVRYDRTRRPTTPQQSETTGGGFYWTVAEEDAIANGSEGEATAAAHFEQVWAQGIANTDHRYSAPSKAATSRGGAAAAAAAAAAATSESDSESDSDSDLEGRSEKVKAAFKFRDPDAWDRRFESQASAPLKLKDEWYVGGECPALLSYLARRVVPSSSCVLQIGCGNSNLGEQLHDSCGLQRLINLDLSATVIEQMRSKRPDLHWMKGDALMLSAQFGEAAFDAVFDKGTLQSVLLMRGGIELSQVLAAEIYKVLRPGGRLVCVVGVQPGLAQYLKGPGLRWRVSYKKVDGDGRPISIYTFTKPSDEPPESSQERVECIVQKKKPQPQPQPKPQQNQAQAQDSADIARSATITAARELGFKVPAPTATQAHGARASPSQWMRRRVQSASELSPRKCAELNSAALARRGAKLKVNENAHGGRRAASAAAAAAAVIAHQHSAFAHFGSTTAHAGGGETSSDDDDQPSSSSSSSSSSSEGEEQQEEPWQRQEATEEVSGQRQKLVSKTTDAEAGGGAASSRLPRASSSEDSNTSDRFGFSSSSEEQEE